MIANSYIVLAVSIAAHAAQFAFLSLVEEPHIRKTYKVSLNSLVTEGQLFKDSLYGPESFFHRDLIVFKNFDWLRSQDLFLGFSVLYTVLIGLPWPSQVGIHLP